MADALERHELCASRFDHAALNPGREGRDGPGSQRTELQRLWYSPHVPHAGGSGLGIRRALHERIGGFDEGLRCLEDTDYCIRAALEGIELIPAEGALVYVRDRSSPRATFRQARLWARANCLLYRRHRTGKEDWRRAWSGYLHGWWRFARTAVRRRGRQGAAWYARRAGWKLGLLEGSLRYRVAPPDFPRVRKGPASGMVLVSPGVDRPGRRGPLRAAADSARLLRRAARRAGRRLRRRGMGTLVSVRTGRPVAALTFDDGPDPEHTPAVLDLLAAHGARATFFLIGERAARHPELVRRIRDEGHAIGNHGWSHRSAHGMPAEALAGELRRTEEALQGAGGRWFRPPYGQLDPGAWRTVRSLGLEVVCWSLQSGDWRPEDPERLALRLAGGVEPGTIVVLHDGIFRPEIEEARDRRFLLEGLDRALTALAGRFEFVRLDELLAAGRPVRRPWFTSGREGGPKDAGDDGEEGGRELREGEPLRGVEGRLRVTLLRDGPGTAGAAGGAGTVAPMPGSAPHLSTFVAGPLYDGMEDNDLRGFLDGGFRWAWNQPTQAHVRVGRPGREEGADRRPRTARRSCSASCSAGSGSGSAPGRRSRTRSSYSRSRTGASVPSSSTCTRSGGTGTRAAAGWAGTT
jgi:peptidoglycan-N-acetylglucosamine deacetylase